VIGGTDIVIPATGSPEALDACARIVGRYWPSARYEDAFTGEKYSHYSDVPIGNIRELLIYPDASAEAAWDADSPESPPNSMIYLLLSAASVTAVVDDPRAAGMTPILESIRNILGMDILNTEAEIVRAEAA